VGVRRSPFGLWRFAFVVRSPGEFQDIGKLSELLPQKGPGVWTFQRLTPWRRRCVPEGGLESRPAIYRRYRWCLEFDVVPEGRSKLGLVKWLMHSLRLMFTVFLAPKIRQPLLVGEILRSDFGWHSGRRAIKFVPTMKKQFIIIKIISISSINSFCDSR
jgi:hypothetical protein